MRQIVVVGITVCGIAGLISAVALNGSAPERVVAPLLVTYIGALLVAASAVVLVRSRALGPLNPVLLFFGYLLILYVVRPAYALLTGFVGTPPIGFTEITSIPQEFTSTLAVLAIALSLLVAGFFAGPAILDPLVAPSSRRLRPVMAPLVIGTLLVVASVLAAFTIQELIAYPGGWQAALTVRNRFFEGRSGLVWGMEIYKFAFLAWLAVLVSDKSRLDRRNIVLFVLLWVPSIVFDFIGGSRAELLLRNVIPVAAVLLAASPPSKSILTRFALVCAAAVLIFVGYRTLVRDQVYAGQGVTPLEALGENFADLGTFIFAGDEVAGFDLLVITRVEVPRYVPYRGAETLLVLAEAPLPRGWLDDKPERGGHALTAALRPTVYARGVNPAFSGAADLYYTGGDLAFVFGFGLIGLVAGMTLRPVARLTTRSAQSAWPLAFGFTAAAAMISVVRADLLEAAFLPVRVGALTILFYTISRRR